MRITDSSHSVKLMTELLESEIERIRVRIENYTSTGTHRDTYVVHLKSIRTVLV